MQSSEPHQFRFEHLFDGSQWHSDAVLEVDADGRISAVHQAREVDADLEPIPALALPGLPNLHSHAFQRAMAGMAERRSQQDDSFWSWRELMYRVAGSVSPDDIESIAGHLYIEMLKAGYTAVCEFHYLHRDPDGHPYSNPAELAQRHIRAAQSGGIALSLLPVLYQRGGFDGRRLSPRQRRFYNTTDEFLELVSNLRDQESESLNVGVAFHSLRAVAAADIEAVLAEVDDSAPIHVHVAEQTAEVEDCVAATGRRPVEWLLDTADIDRRWCLVHATHLSDEERQRMAASGAVAGLCPTTEANLGDGVFPLAEYLDDGGIFGVGSDSHVSVSAVEELRWLEYGQRLLRQRRIVAHDEAQPSCGEFLWARAAAGGAQAAARGVGTIAPGHPADLVVVDPFPADLKPTAALDRFVFATGGGRIRDVMVGGQWRVRNGRHPGEDEARERFAEVVRRVAT